ncbi:MAG TPA: phosphonate C-P lyase system protein PhnH [Rhodospirillaceae bacterium]|nr:phosphonate C-P lyase system protein PhnH [Rhodospirillaceae bacterium]
MTLSPGFDQPVADGQAVFRGALDALARPGSVVALTALPPAPAPLLPAAAALVLALADVDTPLWLDPILLSEAVLGYLRFHCGCPIVAQPSQAVFAVVAEPATMPPLHCFALGDDEYPDRSTTLILQLPALEGGPEVSLAGPGNALARRIAPAGLPAGFWAMARDNHALFPRGVDLLLVAGGSLLALPRSSRVEG